MVKTDEREAAKIKAELVVLLERSRGLLAEEARGGGNRSLRDEPSEGLLDRLDEEDDLSGLELVFDEEPELDRLGEESEREIHEEIGRSAEETSAQESASRLLNALAETVARNPLPWVAGAVVLGALGARRLSGAKSSKNEREKASQIRDFPITHGSLPELIMKTGIDLAKPVLLKASKEWLSRIVETRR